MKILAHVARYHLTTPVVTWRVFFPDKTEAAARKALKRLVLQRHLQQRSIAGRVVYRLTPPTRSKQKKALGVQSAWTRYALLHFCCMRETRRIRLTEEELLEFLDVDKPLDGVSAAHQHFYLEEEKPFLGVAIIDHPNSSAPNGRSMARSLLRRFEKLETTPGLGDLLRKNRLVISVLSVTEQKVTRIQRAYNEALTKAPHYADYPVQFHEIPELQHLI